MVNSRTFFFSVLLLLLLPHALTGQEVLLPVAPQAGVTADYAKAAADTATLPFFDDFSNHSGTPSPLLWQAGGGATVVSDFAPQPPTVGTLMLDAYDENGNLYNHASQSLFGADTATSLPFNLDTLSAADSLVLSFFYLPGGGSGNLWERVGDSPERSDSLILEFSDDSIWHAVWAREGTTADTLITLTGKAWQYVAIAISDAKWFTKGFRFRFRNLASLEIDSKTGRTVGGDQWNIDYVVLSSHRDADDEPSFQDLAFSAPAPSMLQRYRAMPARQYRTTEMADAISLRIANLYHSPLASHYTYAVVSPNGDTIHHYDGGYENAPSFGIQTAAPHANPPVQFSYPESQQPQSYTIVHTITEGSLGDAHQSNDTIRFRQELTDYYAYDDGTAENGYGITSTASRIYLAYRFDLNQPDTLAAIDCYFNRTFQDENLGIGFYLCVWQADEQGLPGQLLYRDQNRRNPVGGNWGHYPLEMPTVVSGKIFVGFEQVGNSYINLGFDRSFNTADRIYYLTGGVWQQSILSGSLMIRPRFGSSALSIAQHLSQPSVSIYPNPAASVVKILTDEEGWQADLCDLFGRVLLSDREGQIDVRQVPSGIYLVRLSRKGNTPLYIKLIVSHNP